MGLQDTSSSAADRPIVLVVGAASRDLSSDDPRGWRLGGVVAYCSLTLARLGLRVRALIGVDEMASTAQELEWLRTAGAELELVRLARGPIFENLEDRRGAGRRVQRCLSPADVMASSSLPSGWDAADAIVFAPVADELPAAWATIPRPNDAVALGWQGLLRRLRAGALVERRPPGRGLLLSRADLVVVSREDLGAATRRDALPALLRPSATLVITDSERGGRVSFVEADGSRRWRTYSAIPSARVIDPTGAGDVFMAAFVASTLDRSWLGKPAGVGEALRFGAAAASLSIERPGLAAVPELSAVLARTLDVPAPTRAFATLPSGPTLPDT